MTEEKQFSSIIIDDTVYEAQLTRKYLGRKKYHPAEPNKICAFIPGVVRVINVQTGQSVKKGEGLMTLEAMKMMNNITAHINGKVKRIFVNEGEMIPKGHPLIELE
jgi:biotin carboxyl carrier protein